MAPTATLSVGCVETLLQSNVLDEHDKYTVQVLEVKTGITKKGGKKYTLTISDGVHCLDCLVASQNYQLLESIVMKYSVVLLENVMLNECGDSVQVLVVHMSHMSNCEQCIGEPTYVKKKAKRQRSPVTEEICLSRNVKSGEIRSRFREIHHTIDDNKQEEKVDSQKRTEVYQGCENCGNIPCDWTEFGPTIIGHLNEDYVGRLVDSNGEVVEDYEDGKCDIITNKQLCFLAYSAYSSLKHCYLGRKKRIPIPHCVGCGIRLHFPDKNNAYVGFCYAED